MENKLSFQRMAAMVIVGAGALGVLYLAGKYVLPAALPFLLAWGGAFFIRPAACALHRRFRIPRKVGAVALCVLCWAALFAVLFFVGRRLFLELRGALVWISSDPPELEAFFAKLEGILASIRHIFSRNEEASAGAGSSALLSLAGALLGKLPEWAGGFVGTLPQGLLFCVVTVIASVFFALDLERINAGVLGLLSPSWQKRLRRWRRGMFSGAWRYVRAYLLLMSITFLIVLCGFWIIGVQYALLLSAICAFVDFLPVLGVGTMLIPWGVFCLCTGDVRQGIGLLLLYGVAVVVREFAEPHLVGREFGMSPLLTLVYLYAGVTLLGFWGLIIGPVVGVLLQSLWQGSRKNDRETAVPNKADTKSGSPPPQSGT